MPRDPVAGGRAGGSTRAWTTPKKKQSEIGKKAAAARWAKYRREAEIAAEIDRRAREIAAETYGDPYADLLNSKNNGAGSFDLPTPPITNKTTNKGEVL